MQRDGRYYIERAPPTPRRRVLSMTTRAPSHQPRQQRSYSNSTHSRPPVTMPQYYSPDPAYPETVMVYPDSPMMSPRSGHPRALDPIDGQTHLHTPPRPYSPGWEQWKRHLSERFGPEPEYHQVSLRPNPPGPIEGHREGRRERHRERHREGRVSSQRQSHSVILSPEMSLDEMNLLAKFLKSHAHHHRHPGKITDIAGRLQHHLPDFVLLFNEMKMARGIRPYSQGSQSEFIFQLGLRVIEMFRSTMVQYQGGLKTRRECSQAENAQAQAMITEMLDRDFKIWDGIIWHILHWIRERHRIHS
ncbi:hypothetical protein F5Y10DRAFT_67428 [Nemania abortiva]|nr:hypothetical protein F5Y10DRAFT_67428 [Nemania abortiva]